MKKKSNEISETNNFFMGIKYSVLSFIISIILMLIFALVLVYTDVSESSINPVIIVISCISVIISSFILSRTIKSKGIICGAIMGGSYFILLYLLSGIISMNFSLSMYSIIMMASCIGTGMFGGILGVNFVRKQ